jgi:hypothetical protein
MYWESITVIEAQDVLIQLKVHDYPYSDNKVRKDLFTQIKKMSEIKSQNKGAPVLLSDFAKILAGKS